MTEPSTGSIPRAPFVELSCMSNFSFLEGASHPEELVERAAQLGYDALGIADRNTLAGAVRAFVAAKEKGVRLVIGARVEFTVADDLSCSHDSHDSPDSHDADHASDVRDPNDSTHARALRDSLDSRIWRDAPDSNAPEDAPRTPAAARSPVMPMARGAGRPSSLPRPRTVEILLFPTSLASYGRLCRLLSRGREIGSVTMRPHAQDSNDLFHLPIHVLLERPGADGAALHEGLEAIVIAPRGVLCMEQWFLEVLEGVRRIIDGDRLSLAVWRLGEAETEWRVRHMRWLSEAHGIPLVAVNDVHMHVPERRPLQDILACIRHGCTIESAGRRLFPNAERHLRAPEVMGSLMADLDRETGALRRARLVADRCAGFSLDQVRYRYPSEVVPGGATAIEELRRLVHEGTIERYPGGASPAVQARLEHELALIDELDYAPYFLTVHDIVRHARSRGILCQGRGAAANSAVCFVLGVTAVDPARIDMLFERFISRERNEPPDIDVDFEHERREEVIQYIYAKYGRHRAAIAAEVISYRGRSAIRDVGKALGFGLDAVDSLASGIDWWHRDLEDAGHESRLRERGLDPRDERLRTLFALASELLGFPRHLSQHVGGFVITEGALVELVPVRAAAMPDRTIIEWDKDDLDAMGLMKVDVLALGMLTAIRKAIDLVNGATSRGIESDQSWRGARASRVSPDAPAKEVSEGSPSLEFHRIPAEDPAVYEMVSRADTVGVFQIESRAQMSMLPRLRPRCFYDLVIEVAIVRPGPIVGNMVHPYLRRRSGEEPVVYPNESIRRVLGKTLGVPLFQEQAMTLAIVAAGFTPGEADALRRAIAAWKRMGQQIARFGEKLIGGMIARGYERIFAEQVFRQIQGFSGYGFPESHAASFAHLVYVSSWLKCHHPAAFTAALINSQPMGFYAPAQLVADAKAHGVEVREIDVNTSAWECSLEAGSVGGVGGVNRVLGESALPRGPGASGPALRLGLRLVSGLGREDGDRIVEAVGRHGTFRSIEALWRASGVGVGALRRLARADAFRAMGFPRQQALWQIRRLRDDAAPLFLSESTEMGRSEDEAMHEGRPRGDAIPPSAKVEAEPGAARPTPSEPLASRAGLSWASERESPEAPVALPPMTRPVEISMDYGAVGVSLRGHPIEFLRQRLGAIGAVTCAKVRRSAEIPSGAWVRCAGIVLVRQRPSTAKGVLFMTIEDETDSANLIIRPKVYERHRRHARHAAVILAEGKVERRGEVSHLLVRRLRSLDRWLAEQEVAIGTRSRDFH
ncbi:MAG: error-prone DNA polymerase [Phycisphaeraceae bacterium]|nr:error-prone DNA polymerase [Phycisphaeraceae bacterium]